MILQHGASVMRRTTPALLRPPTRTTATTTARYLSLLPRTQPPPTPAAPPKGTKPVTRAPPVALSSLFRPSAARRRPHASPNAAPGGEVSDAEYHLRLGRAADLLRGTLGDFLRVGLVDYDSSSSLSGSTAVHDSHLTPVYSPNVAFRVLAPPSEDVSASHATEAAGSPTLAFSGRTWYFASAHILRHTLSALFYDPHVSLERLTLVDARSHPPQGGAGEEQRSAPLPATLMPVAKGSAQRRHAIIVRLRFRGNLRVTGAEHNYTLRFRYDFDPATGQIASHVVERVEPAIGRKLWAGLSTVFLRLAGLSPNHPQPAPTSCTSRRSSLQFSPRARDSVGGTRSFSTSARRLQEADAPPLKQTQIGQIERRLSLTFTCTVEECGHRSAHEFSRRSYEKGIVIVQCPSCKNRHLIADHLSWFKDDGEARTVEAMVKEHGGRVRRGTSFGDADGGETIEIEFDSDAEADAAVAELEAAATAGKSS